MTHDEMIAVIQAHKQGKQLQVRDRYEHERKWKDDADPKFDFLVGEYRVKPEPREFWIHEPNGIAAVIKAGTPASKHPATCPYCIHVREVLD